MVWKTKDAEEQEIPFLPEKVGVFLYLLAVLTIGPPLMFGILITCGPIMIADSLLFWRKRQVIRKQLVSSAVPTVLHILHHRQSNNEFFVSFGYQMDKVSYVAKNEIQVSEQSYELIKNKNTVNLPVSSSYPASGPSISLSRQFLDKNDEENSVCYTCFFGVNVTAFITFIVGTVSGDYYAAAGILVLAGILIAACLYFSWRNMTLYAYQVVNELPSKMIGDSDDNGSLEMGMLVVQEDDDETLALDEECASIRSDETDLEIPTIV